MNLRKLLHRPAPAPVNTKPEIVKEQPMAEEQKPTIDILVRDNGRAFTIPADIGQLLLSAFPERLSLLLPKAPPAPLVRTFGLKELLSGLVAIQWNKGHETGYYDGDPKMLGKYFPDCPEIVAAEYARRYVPRGLKLDED